MRSMKNRNRPPSQPVRILKGMYLGPFSITITELAGKLGVSRKTLSKIVNEHASVTPDMALRLSQAFNTTPELWLNLQRNYDLWYAAHTFKDWRNFKTIPKAYAA